MAEKELPVEIEDMLSIYINTSRTGLYALLHTAYLMGRIDGMNRAKQLVEEHEKKAGL